jgi:hypothetical protein
MNCLSWSHRLRVFLIIFIFGREIQTTVFTAVSGHVQHPNPTLSPFSSPQYQASREGGAQSSSPGLS